MDTLSIKGFLSDGLDGIKFTNKYNQDFSQIKSFVHPSTYNLIKTQYLKI